MKKIILLILLMNTAFCFGQEWIVLYDEKGVSLSYRYEKVGEKVEKDCPNTKLDVYHIATKVENHNDKAIDLNGGMPTGLDFYGDMCNKGGGVGRMWFMSRSEIFMPHRSYGTSTPNTGFGAVHNYFLDANDEYISPSTLSEITVRHGESFPEPKWKFPSWHFIDVPQKGKKNNSDGIKTPVNNTENYSKLILGKWVLVETTSVSDGEKPYSQVDNPPCQNEVYEAGGSYLHDVNGCGTGPSNGSWSISGKILFQTIYQDNSSWKYEILTLDKTSLILKNNWEKGGYALEKYKRK
jgi:hypothetical protein